MEILLFIRKRDIESIAKELRVEGHYVEETDYSYGEEPEDFMVDMLPHKEYVHLKLQLNEYIVTSVGLIIQKKKN